MSSEASRLAHSIGGVEERVSSEAKLVQAERSFLEKQKHKLQNLKVQRRTCTPLIWIRMVLLRCRRYRCMSSSFSREAAMFYGDTYCSFSIFDLNYPYQIVELRRVEVRHFWASQSSREPRSNIPRRFLRLLFVLHPTPPHPTPSHGLDWTGL